MSDEEWRPVEDWPYEVSSIGRVRRASDSYWSAPGQKPAIRGRNGRILKPGFSRGYEKVVLCREGKIRRALVARLVCTAFNGAAPSPEHVVAHNDGNKTRNEADNLRWATSKENNGDMILHGTRIIGPLNHNTRLTADQAREIKRRLKVGESDNTLARAFGVNSGTIHGIKSGRSWAWVEAY